MQQHSSMNTSINTTKLPAVWKKINWNGINSSSSYSYILDYGCGKPQTAQMVGEEIANKSPHLLYLPYDPYWLEKETNDFSLETFFEFKRKSICVCANVLNVIDNLITLNKIVQDIVKAEEFVVQVYEGDKSRQGRKTKEDCYQRNEPTKDYLETIQIISGRKCFRRGNIVYSCKELIK